jgi:N-acetylmuramoyl-L-alanine amidase
MLNKSRFRLLFFGLFLISSTAFYAQTKSKFKVVLDAGHGGKDPGAMYYGLKEKDIALDVTLRVGKILESNPEIKVIYTRKTDVFIELIDRPKIANKEDADLFISIHCNGVKNIKPYGTETFVMGLSRSAANLEVAKKENSVILLENNYQEKYNGFDPNKPESLIGMKLLQEEYLNQSIDLASKIENNFVVNNKRHSRGVKQSPLWVLDASYMPGVLIELGFLSNKNESQYMNSENGKNEMAQAIAKAIVSYKKDLLGSSGTSVYEPIKEPVKESPKSQTTVEPTKNITVSSSKGIVFKVQISASGTKLEPLPKNFKGLSPISREQDGNLYKYLYAEETDYEQIKKRLEEAKKKGFTSAYLVAYKEGVKISVSEALK